MMPHYPNLNIPANINYLYLSTPSISLISKQVVRLFVFCFVLFLVFGLVWFGGGVGLVFLLLSLFKFIFIFYFIYFWEGYLKSACSVFPQIIRIVHKSTRKQTGSVIHVKGFNDMGRFKPLACDITRFITKSHVQVAMGHEWNFKHV